MVSSFSSSSVLVVLLCASYPHISKCYKRTYPLFSTHSSSSFGHCIQSGLCPPSSPWSSLFYGPHLLATTHDHSLYSIEAAVTLVLRNMDHNQLGREVPSPPSLEEISFIRCKFPPKRLNLIPSQDDLQSSH